MNASAHGGIGMTGTGTITKRWRRKPFAEFFEASMGRDAMKVQYIREVFPQAYEEFLKTAGELSQ